MSDSNACPECRHVFPSGARCHTPALRGKQLCYSHARSRTLIDNNRYRQHSVALPPLEDRSAIQMALNEVVAAIAAEKINHRTAGHLLYAISIASQNLTRIEKLPAGDPVEHYEEHIEEVIVSDTPEEERKEISYSEDFHLPSSDQSETHEYDSEPQKQVTVEPETCRPLSSREHKELDEKHRIFLERHYAAYPVSPPPISLEPCPPASGIDTPPPQV
jgi:hypothetical protein